MRKEKLKIKTKNEKKQHCSAYSPLTKNEKNNEKKTTKKLNIYIYIDIYVYIYIYNTYIHYTY